MPGSSPALRMRPNAVRHNVNVPWPSWPCPSTGRMPVAHFRAGLKPGATTTYFDATVACSWLPRIHCRIVRYCQLDSFPGQRWPPLWVAR